ncbi:hypothetical protein [Ulvibacterium sp.]|uniref:hypothetical protein n=1 Tax=Ulvibacterium sp. TaxID=2665914 RepID=UPI003BABDE73
MTHKCLAYLFTMNWRTIDFKGYGIVDIVGKTFIHCRYAIFTTANVPLLKYHKKEVKTSFHWYHVLNFFFALE